MLWLLLLGDWCHYKQQFRFLDCTYIIHLNPLITRDEVAVFQLRAEPQYSRISKAVTEINACIMWYARVLQRIDCSQFFYFFKCVNIQHNIVISNMLLEEKLYTETLKNN